MVILTPHRPLTCSLPQFSPWERYLRPLPKSLAPLLGSLGGAKRTLHASRPSGMLTHLERNSPVKD